MLYTRLGQTTGGARLSSRHHFSIYLELHHSMTNSRINTHAQIMLAFLFDGQEYSGYDLIILCRQRLGHIQAISAPTQIYTALHTLEKHGLVTSCVIPQRSRPDKTVYRITEEGKKAAYCWLTAKSMEPDLYKKSWLVRFCLSTHLSSEAMLALLHERHCCLELRGVLLRERLEITTHAWHDMRALTLALSLIEAEQLWIEATIAECRTRSDILTST